jgi:hypothetical protein
VVPEWLRLVAGLGFALLFGAAGALGAWARAKFPIGRVAVYALLFGVIGGSAARAFPAWTGADVAANLLPSLALCGLAVACWWRWVGRSVWAGAALALAALAVHLLIGTAVDVRAFPELAFLVSGPDGRPSAFPVFPWLCVAAIGALAAEASVKADLIAAAGVAVSAIAMWQGRAGFPWTARLPAVSPIDLAYLLMASAVVSLAFALTRPVNAGQTSRRVSRWLARRWMVFFVLQLAAASLLRRAAARPDWSARLDPATTWAIVVGGSLAATWLLALALAPLGAVLKRPVPWVLILAATLTAGWLPGLPIAVSMGLAAAAGLVFAAHYGALASCGAATRSLSDFRIAPGSTADGRPGANASAYARASSSRDPREFAREAPAADDRETGHVGLNLLRFAFVLVLLAAPEIIRWATGR